MRATMGSASSLSPVLPSMCARHRCSAQNSPWSDPVHLRLGALTQGATRLTSEPDSKDLPMQTVTRWGRASARQVPGPRWPDRSRWLLGQRHRRRRAADAEAHFYRDHPGPPEHCRGHIDASRRHGDLQRQQSCRRDDSGRMDVVEYRRCKHWRGHGHCRERDTRQRPRLART